MIRDPTGMGWDRDGILQLLMLLGFAFAIIALAGASSGNWYDPFMFVVDFAKSNEPLMIGLTMILLMGGYLFHQFDVGRL